MKARIIFLFAFVGCLWGVLLLRASYLQFVPHKKLNALQDKQFKTVINLPARRGSIVDSNGREMAMSAPAYSVYADPSIIDKPQSVANELAKHLTDNSRKIQHKIKDKSKKFIWLERLVDVATADKIRQKKIRGIGLVEEWRRVYPNDFLLSSVIGFIGKEGSGLEGLELHYDKELKGENKKFTLMKDAKGRPIIQDGLMFKELPQGKDIRLTIDSDLQFFVETELQQAIKKHEAEGAYAVVLDAKTSAIKAIASLPHYNLNSPHQFSSYQRRNRSVTDTFEPGSTMKTFVIAEALEQELYTPKSKIFCENGRFKIGKRIIREAESNHAKGLITVSEVLAYSSNIGTTKIAFKLGDKKLNETLQKFGFGNRIGVDMPGEAKGIMLPLPWRDHLLANISFGQGITVTPLQMANAYAAIANGGILNRPYIVESIKDPEGIDEDYFTKVSGKRVMSEEVSQKMRDMLVGVTETKGTGTTAKVPGYVVGGKTGTAQRINKHKRGYVDGGYISSFAGFIPAEDPRYVIFVAIEGPQKGYYASTVASPVFASIGSYVMRKDSSSSLLADADELFEQNEIELKVRKERQEFKAEELFVESEILTSAPNLKNYTVREVFDKIQGKQIKVKFVGSGKVYQTEPEAGKALSEDRSMTVFMKE